MRFARTRFALAGLAALSFLGSACGPDAVTPAPAPKTWPAWDPRTLCETSTQGLLAPTSQSDLQDILEQVQAAFYPQLAGVDVRLQVMQSASDYFASFTDVTTVSLPPLQRTYYVRFNPRLFSEPASYAAVAAIIAHELGHVVDYTQKDTDALVQFALWYGTASDVSAYEHTTDERSLSLGCGTGLKAYREWLYAHVSTATMVQKEHDYYTPAQIDAWMAEHPDAQR